MRLGIMWFRTDLRLTDNEALSWASRVCDFLICVYSPPVSLFENHSFGFPRVGPFRRQFLSESVSALNTDLQRFGQHLVVLNGTAAAELPALAAQLACNDIFVHDVPGTEEIREVEIVKSALLPGVRMHHFWGHTLVHKDDLGFAVSELPQVFTNFRKKIELNLVVRSPLALPSLPPPPPGMFKSDFSIEVFGGVKVFFDQRSVYKFVGGESAALLRLKNYFWESNDIAHYKETRNALLGAGNSSKLSPWLAVGAVSTRTVYHSLRLYEKTRVCNDSTYWLVFELLWRDFFQWVALQQGNLFFNKRTQFQRVQQSSGEQSKNAIRQKEEFLSWSEARTGIAFLDANLLELSRSGWMSNRGRQNVASYFCKELKLSWTWGAAWFESQLLDYDVASNWGNWAYLAGVGNDQRNHRRFNISRQAEMYDPQGEYVNHWLKDS